MRRCSRPHPRSGRSVTASIRTPRGPACASASCSGMPMAAFRRAADSPAGAPEGNRRIAALKLLDNSDLAAGTSIAAQVKRVSKAQSQRITKVDCAIAEDREEAYDADPRVLELYRGLRYASFDIAHSAAKQHFGTEYAVFSPNLHVPTLDGLGRRHEALAVG
jgi:hypothetical protein